MCHHLIMAAKYRDQVTATQLIQKIINILTDKHGAWGSSAPSRPREFWRLDYWEDDLRRRRRFVRNPLGSTHPEATLKAAGEHGQSFRNFLKKKYLFCHVLSVWKVVITGEKEINGTLYSTKLFGVPGFVCVILCVWLVKFNLQLQTPSGNLEQVRSELLWSCPSCSESAIILAYTEGLHGKWLFSEIRSIFSRRYLLQNTALEIFMANRVGVMFNFPDQATVKKVVNCLPRVGIGTIFGLPQTRYFTI
ncbi:LRBA protein, partial [Pygoscelis papua]